MRKPFNYNFYFLLFGTFPPAFYGTNKPGIFIYERDFIKAENIQYEKELIRRYEAFLTRKRVNEFIAARLYVRAILQKRKTFLRIYAPGN